MIIIPPFMFLFVFMPLASLLLGASRRDGTPGSCRVHGGSCKCLCVCVCVCVCVCCHLYSFETVTLLTALQGAVGRAGPEGKRGVSGEQVRASESRLMSVYIYRNTYFIHSSEILENNHWTHFEGYSASFQPVAAGGFFILVGPANQNIPV